MISTALVRIPVGVTIERHPAKSTWSEALWRPVSVFVGVPDTAPWTTIRAEQDVTTFYAGEAVIELHRTETANYRTNLQSGAPLLWVILRPTGGDPPFELQGVTADPAEGEALTGAGNDLVDTVPMVGSIIEQLRIFIAEHHVERAMFKRKREGRAAPSDEPENNQT